MKEGQTPPPRILAIAGSDSSGGAGIQADIKTVTMLGGYAMTAITAVTAQNTQGVQAVHTMSAEFVGAQIAACLTDIGIDAVKIGMLGSPDTAHTVLEALQDFAGPVVFDPVMIATSDAPLADGATIAAFSKLMDRATLITPNTPELAALTGIACDSREGVLEAAFALAERHKTRVLAKGGHNCEPGEENRVTDRLVSPDGAVWSFDHPRIETRHTHGTGCTLSSAIAACVGRGMELRDAVDIARNFVRLALKDAPDFGKGSGPLGHQKIRLEFPEGPSLNQIGLPVRDYDEAVDFYKRLGLTHIVDSPSNGYARFECAGGATISISVGHGEPGGASFYFEVSGLTAARHQAIARGIALDEIVSQSWNWHEAWGRDPTGNRFCLYEAREDRRYPPWRIG